MANEILNLEKAAERILDGIKNKERFILYGDADPDGVSSVVIMQETLEAFGQRNILVHFPNREKEGYGLNEKALNRFRNKAPAVIITFDCGIGNFQEIEKAKKIGFYVIVVDHHRPTPVVAKPNILIDPFQEGDKSSFKDFAAAGLTFKLAESIFQKSSPMVLWEPDRFLELAALATIADQMKLEDENERIVSEGIRAIYYTKRQGLISLIEKVGFQGTVGDIRENLLPLLSAAGPKGNLNEAYLLLIEKNQRKARKLVGDLVKNLEEKRLRQQAIYDEVERRVGRPEDVQDPIIFEGGKGWPLALLGIVASKILQKYQKPVFLYKLGKDESPGAVRAPTGVDSVKAMTFCKDLLITYGGHPPASGFRIKNKNLEKFKNCLIEYFTTSLKAI